jgi:cytochrome c peroxidase
LTLLIAGLFLCGCRSRARISSSSDEAHEASSTPIRYVAADKEEWSRLAHFWNDEATDTGRIIKIKVPLGLDDPTSHIPASNPPTLEKWEIGKRVFFDRTLLPTGDQSLACATCHHPALSFSDGFPEIGTGSMHSPSLLNCVYGEEFFWNGRATGLEDLLNGTFYNARGIARVNPRQDHLWDVAIHLVREDESLSEKIKSACGGRPNRENVSLCLATFLRTLLSGNSVEDRAELERKKRGGDGMLIGDYEKVLDDETIARLDRLQQQADIGADRLDPAKKTVIAEQLQLGHTLFHGKARCIRCHNGPDYSDYGYHNIGIRPSGGAFANAKEQDRFSVLEARSKGSLDAEADRFKGAYRTPSLRGRGRSSPYFHDGLQSSMFFAVAMHFKRNLILRTDNLDPEMTENGRPIDLDLSGDDIRALCLFVFALDGDPPDDVVAKPPGK